MDNQVFWVILAASGWTLAFLKFRRSAKLAADLSAVLDAKDEHEKACAKACRSVNKTHESDVLKIKTLQSALGEAVEKLGTLPQRLAVAEAESAKQAKLAQDRFEMLDGVIQEKQIVWRMYRDSTRQAGTAQNWLMREYGSALQALNTYRRKSGEREIQAPDQLRSLLSEFSAVATNIPDAPPPGTPHTGDAAAKGAP